MFLTTWAMLLLTAVATATDVRNRKIYNWTTYPGILLGLALQWATRGWEGAEDGLWGFFACGGLMLVCFVFFPDLGGGDVKLLAMLGAGLGAEDGILATLWTFVIGFFAGLAMLIWRMGAVGLVREAVQRAREAIVLRGRLQPEEAPEPIQRWLFLAPAALVAVVIVRWEVLWPL